MPLSRVREFVGIDGGPTPRDAVLLKSLLVVHEGIAWAADRPHYRYLANWCQSRVLFFVCAMSPTWNQAHSSAPRALSMLETKCYVRFVREFNVVTVNI